MPTGNSQYVRFKSRIFVEELLQACTLPPSAHRQALHHDLQDLPSSSLYLWMLFHKHVQFSTPPQHRAARALLFIHPLCICAKTCLATFYGKPENANSLVPFFTPMICYALPHE